MEKISAVNFSLGKNQSNVTRKAIPNYPCDSYTPSSKTQKNVSFKGLGILKLFLGGKDTIPYEKFIEKGCTFVDGTALTKAGKKFTGSINVTQQDGTTYILKYVNGLLQSSKKNLDASKIPDMEKIYTYVDGKLSQAETFQFDKSNVIKTQLRDFTSNKILKKILGNMETVHCPKKSIGKTVIDDKKVATYIPDFLKTAEGKRRAALSDAEIEAKVKSLVDESFEKLGLDKSLMPKIAVENIFRAGGNYNANNHILTINPIVYKNGALELEDIVMHEMTHCKEAILRARLSAEKQEATVVKVLVDKIANGESKEIVVKGGFLGVETMSPPVMSEKMKKEFTAVAQEHLYKKTDSFDDDKIKSLAIKLLEDNPDFANQYASYNEALEKLQDYCKSHITRYNGFLDNIQSGAINVSQMPQLTQNEEKLAIESVVNICDTLEGNTVNSTIVSSLTGSGFNQYQFSPEEVLAQQKGITFAIKKLQEQREKLLAENAMTPQYEAYFTSTIDKLKTTLEYKTKGLDWYKIYTKSLNNPNDTALKKLVKKGKAELDKLEKQIKQMPMASLVYRK